MYEHYYGLSSDPFRLLPDPGICFAHRSCGRAWAYLRYALKRGEGIVVVTGAPGSGKTTLAERLLGELNPSKIVSVKLVANDLTPADLMRKLAYALGLPVEGKDRAMLTLMVERHLIEVERTHRRVLVVIDEAQTLSHHSLEAMRLLTDMQSHSQPVMQLVLFGQDELEGVMSAPGMEQFQHRVIASCHLDPMSLSETKAYLEYRLAAADWRGAPSINGPAVMAIYRYSHGVPRHVNKICSRLLLHGSSEEKHVLDGADVSTVVRDLRTELLAPAGHSAASADEGVPREFGSIYELALVPAQDWVADVVPPLQQNEPATRPVDEVRRQAREPAGSMAGAGHQRHAFNTGHRPPLRRSRRVYLRLHQLREYLADALARMRHDDVPLSTWLRSRLKGVVAVASGMATRALSMLPGSAGKLRAAMLTPIRGVPVGAVLAGVLAVLLVGLATTGDGIASKPYASTSERSGAPKVVEVGQAGFGILAADAGFVAAQRVGGPGRFADAGLNSLLRRPGDSERLGLHDSIGELASMAMPARVAGGNMRDPVQLVARSLVGGISGNVVEGFVTAVERYRSTLHAWSMGDRQNAEDGMVRLWMRGAMANAQQFADISSLVGEQASPASAEAVNDAVTDVAGAELSDAGALAEVPVDADRPAEVQADDPSGGVVVDAVPLVAVGDARDYSTSLPATAAGGQVESAAAPESVVAAVVELPPTPDVVVVEEPAEEHAAPVSKPDASETVSEQQVVEQRIRQLLDKADRAIAANRLLLPEKTSAYKQVQAALKLDPQNAGAKRRLATIVERYAELTFTALEKQQFDRAARFAARAKRVDPNSRHARRLVGEVKAARAEARAVAQAEADRKFAELAAARAQPEPVTPPPEPSGFQRLMTYINGL